MIGRGELGHAVETLLGDNSGEGAPTQCEHGESSRCRLAIASDELLIDREALSGAYAEPILGEHQGGELCAHETPSGAHRIGGIRTARRGR